MDVSQDLFGWVSILYSGFMEPPMGLCGSPGLLNQASTDQATRKHDGRLFRGANSHSLHLKLDSCALETPRRCHAYCLHALTSSNVLAIHTERRPMRRSPCTRRTMGCTQRPSSMLCCGSSSLSSSYNASYLHTTTS